jgi:hypothetical protein
MTRRIQAHCIPHSLILKAWFRYQTSMHHAVRALPAPKRGLYRTISNDNSMIIRYLWHLINYDCDHGSDVMITWPRPQINTYATTTECRLSYIRYLTAWRQWTNWRLGTWRLCGIRHCDFYVNSKLATHVHSMAHAIQKAWPFNGLFTLNWMNQWITAESRALVSCVVYLLLHCGASGV